MLSNENLDGSNERTALISPIESEQHNNFNSINNYEQSYQNQKPLEYSKKGEKKCPTCKGTGKVYQEEQNKLVALIPLSDKRLKPKRIWLWTLSTCLICLLAVAVLTYLLAPRSIIISNDSSNLKPYNYTYIKDRNLTIIGIVLYFDESFIIENHNFYNVQMRNITLELNRNSHVTLPKLNYKKNLDVPARSNILLDVKVKYIMYTLNDPYASLCINGVLNDLFTLISTSFSFQTLWNSELLIDFSKIQYISCSNKTLSNQM